MNRAFSILAITMALAGCDRTATPEQATDGPTAAVTSAAASPPVAAASVPAPSPTPTAELSAPGAPSLSRDPAEVMKAWATAVQVRDWTTVRSFWGDHGERSGLTDKAFATTWSSLLDPKVTVYPGEQEGAAGSLYYTAPVRIIDGPRTVRGEVVLRRVNDVPGATEEQLRWHIESTTLEP